MRLLSPWWLLLLLPVAALALTYVLQQRRRSRYAVRFATLPMLERLIPQRPGWRRHLPASLLLLAFTALAVGAARPEMDVSVPRENATVIVAIDVSLSMREADIEPSRIEAASDAAAAFVRELPEDFNVGVVTFAETATVLSQPTTDHERAAAAFEGLTLSNRTAIGEGVFTSLRQVEIQARATGADDIPAHVVLLSDGSNTYGRPPSLAAEAAERAGVPVSTIAYGTTEDTGVRVPGSSPVDLETMADVAETTGGTAYTAADSDQLAEVYDDIRSSVGWRSEPTEISPYLAALALLSGLAAAALSLRWFVRLP